MITFDEFKKVELQVATITGVEKVAGSNKLLKLQIDLGDETRQLLAGLAEYYSPEELINTQIVVVANLEPKKLMGLESQGMLLAANGDTPQLLRPAQPVPAGTQVF